MLLLCKLWPWLAGGLIGWLLSGWLARKLKYGEPPVERTIEKKVEVEKVIDNPKHLSLISKLEGENSQISGLMTQISDYKNRKPEIVEKIIEKLVDNPDHLKRIKELENRKPETVEKIVEKEVVKNVDNPEHLTRIKVLEDEAEKRNGDIGDLRSKLMEWENKKPETIEKIVEKEVVKQVDNPAHLKMIGSLEDEIKVWKRGPAINVPAAKAAGIAIKAEDDFTAIEGIGPKINDLIHADGIHTFRELSETDPARIQKILDKAGANFQMANPGTWPDQANLACNNRWPALKALQDILDGGVYPDPSAAGSQSEGGSAGGSDNSAEYTARITALEAELKSYKTGPATNFDLAKASGFNIRRNGDQDDFTVIEGIGPKINELIHADGIHKYVELARTEVGAIQKILDKAGSNFELARPATWPDQSDLAAYNRWEALKSWQDVLDGGKE